MYHRLFSTGSLKCSIWVRLGWGWGGGGGRCVVFMSAMERLRFSLEFLFSLLRTTCCWSHSTLKTREQTEWLYSCRHGLLARMVSVSVEWNRQPWFPEDESPDFSFRVSSRSEFFFSTHCNLEHLQNGFWFKYSWFPEDESRFPDLSAHNKSQLCLGTELMIETRALKGLTAFGIKILCNNTILC